jgi:hypothetical protein
VSATKQFPFNIIDCCTTIERSVPIGEVVSVVRTDHGERKRAEFSNHQTRRLAEQSFETDGATMIKQACEIWLGSQAADPQKPAVLQQSCLAANVAPMTPSQQSSLSRHSFGRFVPALRALIKNRIFPAVESWLDSVDMHRLKDVTGRAMDERGKEVDHAREWL